MFPHFCWLYQVKWKDQYTNKLLLVEWKFTKYIQLEKMGMFFKGTFLFLKEELTPNKHICAKFVTLKDQKDIVFLENVIWFSYVITQIMF